MFTASRAARALFSTAPHLPPPAAAGRLLVWGVGAGRTLGLADENDREEPVELPALRGVPVVQVALGKYHAFALSAEGDVWAWGADKYGQLGHGSTASSPRPPERVAALCGKGVRQLAAGHYHSAAVLDDGSLLTWGYGGTFFQGEGGLGHGGWSSTATPTPVAGFGAAGERVLSVSCGGYHSIALTAERNAYSWGRGEGRLGHGGPAGYKSPLKIEQLVGLEPTQVFACEKHSACLTADGRVHTWGYNDYWQLGYEVTGFLKSGQSYDLVDEPTAVDVPLRKAQPQTDRPAADGGAPAAPADGGAPAEAQLAVGLAASSDRGMVAVSADGAAAIVWGFSKFFEPQLLAPAAAEPPLDARIVQAAAGAEHVLLLTARGSVYTWGTGAVLGVAQPLRQQFALARHESFGQLSDSVLAVACGAHCSAAIVV